MTSHDDAGSGKAGMPIWRAVSLALGALAAIPALALVALLPTTPITLGGAAYLAATLLIIAAMLTAPWRRRRLPWLGRLGILSLALSAALQLAAPSHEVALTLLTGPAGDGARLASRLFDEQDIVLFGERVAARLGLISAREDTGLVDALGVAYGTMRSEGAITRSPFLHTALGQQTPEQYDLLVAEPPSQARAAVIFLHGYGGNFALQCWLLARPALRFGIITVCPSTGVRGDWWTERGARVVRRTIGLLRERGIGQIYLAGISNGGVSVSRLAPGLADDLAGLILISGADPTVAPPALPVLLLHGAQDERMPASLVQRYADAAGDRAEAHIVDGDHFVLLKRSDELQAVLASWLARQQGGSAAALATGAGRSGSGTMASPCSNNTSAACR